MFSYLVSFMFQKHVTAQQFLTTIFIFVCTTYIDIYKSFLLNILYLNILYIKLWKYSLIDDENYHFILYFMKYCILIKKVNVLHVYHIRLYVLSHRMTLH